MTTRMSLSAVCHALDGPEQIVLEKVSVGSPGENEVIVRVQAASLNFPDVLMTYGQYQFKPELPFTIGMEGAGNIVETGSGCKRFKVGDRVLFKGKTGACSEYVRMREEELSVLPETLTFEQGAAFSITFHTAYVALAKRGFLKRGETLLVSGAGGGVGQASVAVGNALGASVIAMASTEEKLAIAKKSGAEHSILYDDYKFSDRVMQITEGRGVDVILDPVGGPVLAESTECLAWAGRLLTVGFASHSFGSVPLKTLQKKGAALIGVRAGEYGRRNPAAGQEAQEELLKLAREKELRPWIGGVQPLEKVAQSLKAMEQRKISGKQVVRMTGAPEGR
ncbi:MAG: NADPH:quinone oxidoreductase family protein [Sneathiella sp.]